MPVINHGLMLIHFWFVPRPVLPNKLIDAFAIVQTRSFSKMAWWLDVHTQYCCRCIRHNQFRITWLLLWRPFWILPFCFVSKNRCTLLKHRLILTIIGVVMGVYNYVSITTCPHTSCLSHLSTFLALAVCVWLFFV